MGVGVFHFLLAFIQIGERPQTVQASNISIRYVHRAPSTRQPGVGKSFLACALGNQACRSGYSTNYFRFPRLLETLLAARGEGTFLKLLSRLAKTSLLIFDDFGLSRLSASEAKDFLEILDDRSGSASTILTSQLPLTQWHEIIEEPTLADALCDRLFHSAFKLQLKGESLRKRSNSK